MGRIKDLATQIRSFLADDFHDADGATAGSRKISPFDAHGQFRNALAPRGGVAFDGTNGGKLTSPLGTVGQIGPDPFSVSMLVRLPSTLPVTGRKTLWAIVNSGEGDVSAFLDASGLNVFTYAGGAGGQRGTYISSTVLNGYAGKVVHFVFVRNGSALPKHYLNSVSQTLTEYTYAGGGAIPADWGGSVTAANLRFGDDGGNRPYPSNVLALSLYNLALSDSDVQEIFELGGAVPERFKFGSQVNYLSGNDANFSGAGNWAANGTASATVTGGQLVATGLTHSASNYLSSPTWAQSSFGARTLKRRYRVSFDVAALTLSGGATSVNVFSPVFSNGTPIGSFSTTGTKTFDFDYVSGGGDGNVMLGFYRNETSGQCDVTLDNVSIKTIGAVVHLPLDDGLGFQLQDVSTNRLHALMTTTGVSHVAPLYGPAHIRTTTNTNGNQQLCGGTVLPATTQILKVRARSQSGTPSVTLGTASGGSQVVASVALSTTWKDLTIALTGGINTAANSLWAGSNSTAVIEWDITWEPLSI